MKRSLAMLWLLLPLTASGQTTSPWIGRRVIIEIETVPKLGNQVDYDEKRSTNLALSGKDKAVFRIYRVEHVKGNWLWLKAEKEGTAGWAQRKDVIPYNKAIDYFTNQIRKSQSRVRVRHAGPHVG